LLAHLATDDEAVDDAGAIESVAKEA